MDDRLPNGEKVTFEREHWNEPNSICLIDGGMETESTGEARNAVGCKRRVKSGKPKEDGEEIVPIEGGIGR
jgi:hypothetical protein